VRYQVSEAISNGEWPFWSPYFNLGYPLHGDMMSGVWNPFVWLFSLAGTYTMKTLQYETLLYVYLSGMSMYFLCRHFITNRTICLLASASYMLCGYNSDSAQFLNWISSAAFLPWVFLFYYRLLTEQNLNPALLTALSLYLLFTTSYPADFILMLYLMLGMLIWKCIQTVLLHQKIPYLKFIKLHAIAVTCFILLSMPAIVSYIEFLPLATRGNGVSLAVAMTDSYHPLLLFSYITPLNVWRAPGVAITDPLARNSFIGIIPFILLVTAFLVKSSHPLEKFSKGALCIFLLFSFGEWGLLRTISYYTLPLMDTFRHPANARIFTIFFGCLLSAMVLQNILLQKIILTDTLLKRLFLSMIAFIAGLLIWVLLSSNLKAFVFHLPSRSISSFKTWLDQLGFLELTLFNIFLQFPFMWVIWKWYKKALKTSTLVVFSIINCIIHTALFQPFTVVQKETVRSFQSKLKNVTQAGYPLPDLKNSIMNNNVMDSILFSFIGPANLYNKRIGRSNYRISPSNLLTQDAFWHNKTIRENLLKQPFIYKADTAMYKYEIMKNGLQFFVLLEDTALISRINSSAPSTASIIFNDFAPNQFSLLVRSSTPGFYAIFQNHYPRWQVLIDGKSTTPLLCNNTFMGFWLEEGMHEVTFQYRVSDLIICILISLFTLLITAFLLFFKSSFL